MADLQTQLIQAWLEACECELNAFKPGNVSIYSDADDMTVDDFRISAVASAPFITDPTLSLGEKIFHAVQATRIQVGCNTNLGIILLCAPLLQAMQLTRHTGKLQERLCYVLDTTTQNDTQWTYRAIQLAAPGGLGQSTQQDVYSPPDVTLTEAMRLANHRDHIAYQYNTRYSTVFEIALVQYHLTLNRWDDECWTALAVFLDLLRHIPDSHIERKFGKQHTPKVAARAAFLFKKLSTVTNPESIFPELRAVDTEFKSEGINPGTTADLTVACLLSARLEALLAYSEVPE